MNKNQNSQSKGWFFSTYKWWFTSLYGRLGLLFFVAAFILVFLTYMLLNFEFFYKDTILDAHDAYHHFKMVEGWNYDPNSNSNQKMAEELKNLHLFCQVYNLSDSLESNHRGPLWSNQSAYELNLFNYQSYNDNEIIDEELIKNNINPVEINGYVSFGQLEMPPSYGSSYFGNTLLLEASVVEYLDYKYLIVVTDYEAPSEVLAFAPIIALTLFFMFALYLLIRFFLLPIDIMRKRIIKLEKGDLSSKILVTGKDELAVLSNKFNDLVAQVKFLLEQKERLLSEVSHELRTPLAKMKLLLELEPSEKNKNKINNQIEYLNSLITNILIADKMSAPYSELSKETVNIGDLIKKSTEFAKTENINFNVDAQILVNVDVVKISIVIKNIIDNASKYAPCDTPLKIQTIKTKNMLFLLFIDAGPGIDPKLLSTIIQPFVQGSGNRKKGFGLGLAICKKVLDAHKGSFDIKNNADKGCTFTVGLPIFNHAKK